GVHGGGGGVDEEGLRGAEGRAGGGAVDVLGAPVVGAAAGEVVAGGDGGGAVGVDGEAGAGGVEGAERAGAVARGADLEGDLAGVLRVRVAERGRERRRGRVQPNCGGGAHERRDVGSGVA